MTSSTPCSLNYCNLGHERDVRDAQAVLTILQAISSVRTRGAAHAPITRRALTDIWQWPRLPKGNGHLGGNKPETVRWSPEALKVYNSLNQNRNGRRENPKGGILVAEHLVPLDTVSRQLLLALPPDAERMVEMLRHRFEASPVVVITKEEDQKVDKKGWRSTTPDPQNPWKRYEDSIGVGEGDCTIPNPHCICDE